MAIVNITEEAAAQLRQLPDSIVTRLVEFLRYHIAKSLNPRHLGSALEGPLAGIWCYRLVGHKLLVDIQGENIILFAVNKDVRVLPYG